MPKTKRKIHLEQAREAKKLKLSQKEATIPDEPPEDELPEEPTIPVPPAPPASSNSTETQPLLDDEKMKDYVEKWTSSLSRDNLKSLAMTLHYALVVLNGVKQTDAANQIANLILRNERTVREWKYSFFQHEGSFPDSQQGKYQRQGQICK